MNSQTRRELDFLQEQALLLEKNSVSLTQIINPKTANGTNGNKQQNVIQTPNVHITPSNQQQQQQQQPTSSSPASNLSKYSQLLMVIEEMGKDIR